MVATCANLTDESGSNSGVADADFDLSHQDLCQFAAGLFRDDWRISEIAIPAAAHDDVNSRSPRKPDQPFRIATDLIKRDITDRATSPSRKLQNLLSHYVFIINDQLIAVTAVVIHRIKK